MQDAAESKEQCILCIEDGVTLEERSVMPLSDGFCSETATAMVHFLKTSELYLAYQNPHAVLSEVGMMSIRSILENVLYVHEGVSVASICDEWGEIYILDDDEFRILKFDYLYEQSKMLRSAPHVPVFNYIKAMLLGTVYTKPGSALLLGLGGGSLVRALHCILPHLSQTVVEIRPLMIEMAMQYFGIPSSEAIQIIQQDARLYLEQQEHKHDLIFADLYWALQMDPMQSEHDFVRLCRSNLSSGGWLVVNYQERSEVEPDLICALYQHFDDVFLCQIPDGNTVLYAGTISSALSGFSAHSWLGEIEQKLECNLDILNQTLIRL